MITSPRRRSAPRRVAACLDMTALFAAPPLTSSQPAHASELADRYTFTNVKIGGTGVVTGIVFSPAQKDLAHARTDVGGLYRWNGATGVWTPLTDWVDWDHWGYMGVAAVAPSATDPGRVWAAVGMYTNGVDPNNCAVLRSTDSGAPGARPSCRSPSAAT